MSAMRLLTAILLFTGLHHFGLALSQDQKDTILEIHGLGAHHRETQKHSPGHGNAISTPQQAKHRDPEQPQTVTLDDLTLSDQLSTPPNPGISSTTTPMSSSVLEASPQAKGTDAPYQIKPVEENSLGAPSATPRMEQGSTSQHHLLQNKSSSWLMSLDEILEVWEPRSVNERWSGWLRALHDPSLGDIGASPDDPTWRNCSRDVAAYLDALRDAKGWALVLSDASGRAPRGLFEGNGYWLGSRALCADLDPTGAKGSPRISTLFHRKDVDPTMPPTAGITAAAPFPLSFFVAKLAVNISSAELRLAQRSSLGLCLPASCSLTDVSRLLRAAIRRPDAVRLLSVRQLQHDFHVWTDPTFIALVVVGGLAIVLSVIATALDVFLEPPSKPHRVTGGCDVILRLQGATGDAVGGAAGPRGPRCAEPAPCATWRIFVRCLSLRSNLQKIFSLRVGVDALVPVHGLRVISLLWVILAHVSLIIFHLADNKDFRSKAEGDFLYQALSSGTFSVDTFFLLSGLLLSYMYLHSCSGQPVEGAARRLQQFGTMLLYRFLRLTPPYMFVLGAVQVSMQHFHASAVAELPTRDHITCPQYWWRNLLYINTFYPNSERCMAWSWYLADDTQFYVIGTVLLIIGVSYLWAAVGAMAVFLISSWVTTAAVAYTTHHITNFREPFAHYDELYDKPWTRIGPYLIGMGTGWVLWRTRCQIRIHPVAAGVGWLVAAAALGGCVFGLYGVTLSPAASAAFVALSHSAWALAVAWVLVACLAGRGGWVSRLLGWRGLLPASRLCYCAYLLHPLLMRSMALHADSAFHMSRDHIAVLFVGFCVSSFGLALVLSVILEAPIVSLLSALRPRMSTCRPTLPTRSRMPPRVPLPVPHMPESWKTAGFGY